MNPATQFHFAVEEFSTVRVQLLGLFLLAGGLFLVGCGTVGGARTGGGTAPGSDAAEPTAPESETASTEPEQSSEPKGEPEKVLRLSKVSARLESAAQKWYGTPYKWGGSTKQGVDCSGFVQNLYEDAFSIGLPRVTETQLQAGTKVARDQIRPGDLVFFRPEDDYNHVGVYVGEGTFVHASSSEGVRKSPLDKDYWEQYYWTTRRPLKPSRVPDSLTSDLMAYQYPDTTVQATNSPPMTETASTSNDETPTTGEATPDETTAASAEGTGATQIASCSDSGVECADSAPSGPTASADTTLRKGW